MGKYWLIFKNSISVSLVYRANVFLTLLSEVVILAVYIALWTAIYAEGNSVGNYSLTNLIAYYIVAHMIAFVIQNIDVAWIISDEINQGRISVYILQPLNYLRVIIFRSLGKMVFNFFALIIILVFAFPFLGKYLPNVDWIIWLLFFLAMIFSFLIYVLFFFIIGILTFWLGTSQGVNFSFRMMMLFFSGYIIPIDLLPNWIVQVGKFLPFQFVNWFPVAILSGREIPILENFMVVFVWTIFLFLVAKIIFNLGLKKYEGFGA